MQFTSFCSNQSKSPFVGYIAKNVFLEAKCQINAKYILWGSNSKQTLISLIPSSSVLPGEILLSSVIMELLSIQHGNTVQIQPLIKHVNEEDEISEITIELSSLFHYPFPTVLLSQLESSFSISNLICKLYGDYPLSSPFQLLLPINQTFIQGTICSSYPVRGKLTSATRFHFTVKPPTEWTVPPQLSPSVTRMMHAITYTLKHESSSPYTHVNGLVIIGQPGSGKTMILREIVRHNDHSLLLSANEFYLTDPSTVIQSKSDTQLVCFDDLTENSFSESFVQLLHTCFSKQILVVAAVSSLDGIPAYLLKEEFFNQQIFLHTPTRDERSVVLNQLLHSYLEENSIALLTQHTSGYCYKDIHAIAKQVVMHSLDYQISVEGIVSANPISLSEKEIIAIVNDFIPSSLIGFDVRKSSMKLSDVGGYKQQKEQLYSLLSLVSKQPDQLKRFNLTPAAGILLYGPPGCGKSYIIPAVIGELNSYYIYVDSPSLFSKYFSETETNIRHVFTVARSVAPCVIVFDQLEVLAGKRTLSSANDGGFNERIVTTLLTELDGVDNTNTGITVIGITSDVNRLDDAIVRPGRLGTHIYMGKPSEEDRVAILKIQTREMPMDDAICYEEIAKQVDGFSGAQLRWLCTNAAYAAMNDEGNKEQTIKQNHFNQCFHSEATGKGEWYS